MADGTDKLHSRFAHFLQRAGFTPAQWSLAIDNSGHERGIRATHSITIHKPTTPTSQQPIISIPASLLITPARVRSSTFARSLLSASALASLSAEQLLILWLVYQRRQGERSSAYPYLALLPSYYSSLEWWTEAEVQLLPRSVDTSAAVEDEDGDGEAAGQNDPVHYHRTLCTRIRAQWQQLNTLLSEQHPALQPCQHDQQQPAGPRSLPLSVDHHTLPTSHPLCPSTAHPLSCLISLAEYQWAYSTVATRSCYWPESEGGGSCCLIPFLDMLNHSSTIVCTCRYNPATRLYSLYTQHKQSAEAEEPLLRVAAGSEVYISYGMLCNWQLLVRYGFVLDENVDEKDDVSVQWLEAFFRRRCTTKERLAPSKPQPAHSRQPVVRPLSDVRCCCGRSQLWQSLANLNPSASANAQLPSVPPLSSKHTKLLSLCGLYTPATFPLTCCSPPVWNLTTYIKCRTIPLPPPPAPQPTNDTLARWAEVVLEDGWVDGAHERRGREVMVGVLVERMGGGGGGGGGVSVVEMMGELEGWRARQGCGDGGSEKDGGSECKSGDAGGASVSVLCRVLSGQFRVARRRMLLGALQHQLEAIHQL